MSEWAESALFLLAAFEKGRKVSTAGFPASGYLPYLGAEAISGGNQNEYAHPNGAVVADEHDVLMLWDGERSGLVGKGRLGVVSSTAARLSPCGSVGSGFLFYALDERFEWIQGRRTGTGIPHVPKDLGRILCVSYPTDRGEQARIVEILSTVDEAIEQTKRLLAKHQLIKAGLMHDLFTCGLTPHARLRPRRDEAPHLYKNSPFGPIPKEWEIHRAESLTAGITKGTTPSGLVEEEQPDFVPFIRVQNLSFDGSLAFESDVMFVARAVHVGVLARSIVYPGDVLMNIVGPPLGKVSIVPDSHVEWNINQAIAVFRPRDPGLRDYVANFLLSAVGQSWLARRAKRTSGQVNLTLELCRDLPVPMPRDDSERDMIARVLGACDQAIRTERDFLRKLNREKCGLMHDLLTGEVTVPIPETNDA